MKILDNSAINFILKQNIDLDRSDVFYVTEDVNNEAELAAFLQKKLLARNIVSINQYHSFREDLYYKNYKEMLNKHRGRSFFNMTGIGDISILAAVKTIFECWGRILPIPGMGETIDVYVDDRGLINRLTAEFLPNSALIIHQPSDLAPANTLQPTI
jgi:hypothetical protein